MELVRNSSGVRVGNPFPGSWNALQGGCASCSLGSEGGDTCVQILVPLPLTLVGCSVRSWGQCPSLGGRGVPLSSCLSCQPCAPPSALLGTVTSSRTPCQQRPSSVSLLCQVLVLRVLYPQSELCPCVFLAGRSISSWVRSALPILALMMSAFGGLLGAARAPFCWKHCHTGYLCVPRWGSGSLSVWTRCCRGSIPTCGPGPLGSRHGGSCGKTGSTACPSRPGCSLDIQGPWVREHWQGGWSGRAVHQQDQRAGGGRAGEAQRPAVRARPLHTLGRGEPEAAAVGCGGVLREEGWPAPCPVAPQASLGRDVGQACACVTLTRAVSAPELGAVGGGPRNGGGRCGLQQGVF